MNKKEYDDVFKYATITQLIQVLFWSAKKRYYFDVLINRGYSFFSAFQEVNTKTKKQINDFFISKNNQQ